MLCLAVTLLMSFTTFRLFKYLNSVFSKVNFLNFLLHFRSSPRLLFVVAQRCINRLMIAVHSDQQNSELHGQCYPVLALWTVESVIVTRLG